MSSLAQEEARSISKNVTWGQRRRFEKEKVFVPFKRLLGYDKGENGELVVDPEQAKIVRRIYAEFLKGNSPHRIAKNLTVDYIPTLGGKTDDRTTLFTAFSGTKNTKVMLYCKKFSRPII